jgi:hypothetical protein
VRSKFSWYLKPTEHEIKQVWDTGTLTVDANVLLDMYRYHERTRRSLLESVKAFKGRLWLSHQAATEFFRNRAAVIASCRRSFNEANDAVESIEKALANAAQSIRNARIIPEETTTELKEQISKATSEAREKIAIAESSHPNYMESDQILDEIMDVFSGAVGEPFPESELRSHISEADKRIKEKIPPGYMDASKDGQRPYGDFFFWKQILRYAKDKSTPIILVTSDRKEDWWEKHSGTTSGPRYDLLKEANELAGQRVLFYQTDQFLKAATAYKSKAKSAESDAALNAVIEEIRAVDAFRLKAGGAVKVVDQTTDLASRGQNRGFLIAEISRPVFMFTASGHFVPELASLPRVSVQLISSSRDMPDHRVYARTGTTHDFNIHVKSMQHNTPLPPGIYAFYYDAQTPQPSLFE